MQYCYSYNVKTFKVLSPKIRIDATFRFPEATMSVVEGQVGQLCLTTMQNQRYVTVLLKVVEPSNATGIYAYSANTHFPWL